MEERLDKVLMERGLVTSRTRGEELIKNGDVLVNGVAIDKPGKKIAIDAKISLINEELPWVSRGALKLIKALDHWNVSVEGLSFMDIGASTGGFTEVLLSRGAEHVTCIDVGHGQLHQRLADNPKITNFEKTHVRELTTHHFPTLQDGAVIDVSFISLEKVFPFIQSFLKEGSTIIALIKPQFELERKLLNKHGIVRSSLSYPQVLENVKRFAADSHFITREIIESPIFGGDGNREFLALLEKA
ncbi:MAG TPA: TlyA family RNA methyltransferase [Fluviicola sp.]|nr:TlyA family RNA methyltransferase [Fluviicola sp.]